MAVTTAAGRSTHGRLLRYLLVSITAVLLAAFTGAPANAEGRGTFERGVEAARAGDYDQAVELFRAARYAGVETPALFFNLGVALYHLDRLEEAAGAFERAAQSRAMGGPASYNLGRIARERGDEAAARYWFEQAAQRARTEAVRQRARAQVSPDPREEPSTSVSGAVGLGIGHDSNIALTPADSGVSRESDEFALTEGYLQADWGAHAYLFASAYAERYASANEYDLSALQAGAGWDGAAAPWPTHRLSVRHTRFDGEAFEHAVHWDARTRYEAETGVLGLDLGVGLLRGAEDFRYLNGHRWHFETSWGQSALGGWWTSRFRLTSVDRDDLHAQEAFYSYSYRRHDLTTSYRRTLFPNLDLTLAASWAHYRYADRNTGTEGATGRRKEDDIELRLGLEYDLAPNWRLTSRFQAQERRANLDPYAYDRTLFTTRLIHEF